MEELESEISHSDSDLLRITPLGAGQEVGRSCHLLEFKEKKIMLDCGIHPGISGLAGLPYLDFSDPEKIDLLLVTHFHLDHAGGLPWFLQKTPFKGRVFMTHATKAIYRWLLSDYIKVSNISTEDQLYTEADLEESMTRIETINFHEEKVVNGIKFWCYHAGHVLGAAMFMIEIAGVRVLYTGDYSREEDRHLMAAEIPAVRPDVLITEATYGTHIHEPREEREARFTNTVTDIVNRGGRCLIPVFALGRAQELLLILDDYWSNHPELHDIPIYYASSLAKKCMAVYQTYSNAMNHKIQKQLNVSNPFQFKHISNLKGMEHFDDVGPSVVMASPGMMQSGLSRELFESWCTDHRNGVIVAGYCVEGTLAKHILSEPEEVVSMSGQKIPLKLSVDYISFSAHADYKQCSEFVRAMKPPHVVLVHGEANEMGRLKAALNREYEDDPETSINIHNPKNTESVQLYFKGEKMAKVMGDLAIKRPNHGETLSGILVKRNFNYHILAPSDLSAHTNLSTSALTQRQSVSFTAPLSLLKYYLHQLSDDVVTLKMSNGREGLRIFGAITVVKEVNMLVLEWAANPVNDMYADAVLAIILRVDTDPQARKIPVQRITKPDLYREFKDRLEVMLESMFGEHSFKVVAPGEDSLPEDEIHLEIDNLEVKINSKTRAVSCPNDSQTEEMLTECVQRLYATIMPVGTA
uniref:Cleavage and polyadenylation specificity factor subunit 3 n=1 Tax=Phallusia mammillata TaxID=59560 RepID=A0A6F9DA43_9ASCI|nr:cleavage and polyadenylation specificity factor subunit 3 [Phallusia mammillata]